jgi:hypothetical protein
VQRARGITIRTATEPSVPQARCRARPK